MYENLIVDSKGRIGYITINRPEIKNAINEKTMLELRSALRELRSDNRVKVIIITGIKDSFSAGMDLKSVHGLMPEKVHGITALGRLLLLEINTGYEYNINPSTFFKQILETEKVVWAIGDNWKPVIAQINGYALGGGLELASACDFRFASDSAILGYPEVDLRIFPAWGGTQFTTKLIGYPETLNLICTCNKITAAEAKELKLVNNVFPVHKLAENTLKFAKSLASKEMTTLKHVKMLVEQSFGEQLLKGLALEYKYSSTWK